MNVLAKKQKQILSSQNRKKVLSQEEFNDFYFKLRHRDEKGVLGQLSLKTRRKLHKLVLMVFTIKNRISGFRCVIVNDKRCKTNRPIIYALTHIGKFDIEVTAVAIKEHFYVLSGDYEHLQGTIDGAFLLLNGVFYFNEFIKRDRKSVSEKMIDHLKEGGNIMYFPEGTWNLTPNLPVLPCYWGIVDIAQKGNAIIVPVAVEQYGKRFKVNIGEEIDMSLYGIGSDERLKAINMLRDILATLKWEIWETEPIKKRCDIRADEWNKYITRRFKEWSYFSMDYINKLTFKPKQ